MKEPMSYTDLPKDLQEWGRQIEQEYINTISDRALAFQAAEKEVGRTVSITEAVNHVIARIRKVQESKVEPLSAEDQEYLNRLSGKATNFSVGIEPHNDLEAEAAENALQKLEARIQRNERGK